MTKAKANSNQSRIKPAHWLNWEIRDFKYQVDVYDKSGKVSENHPAKCSDKQDETVEPKK